MKSFPSVPLFVFFFMDICLAAFPPGRYAVYQLSKIDSFVTSGTVTRALVSPLKAVGISENLYMRNVTTKDVGDTSFFTVGPPWLWPDADSIGHAIRFKNDRYFFFSVANSAPRHTFAFSFFMESIDTMTDVFQYAYAAPPDYSPYFHLGIIKLAPNGRIVVYRDMGNVSYDTLPSYSIRPGVWMPMVVDINTEGADRNMCIFLGDSCVIKLRIGPANPAGTTTISLFERGSEIRCGDLAHFEDVGGDDVFNNYMVWEPVADEACTDTMVIPLVVHQILYDPPGDGSVSTLTRSNTITNRVTVQENYQWGGSVFAGYEENISAGIGVVSFDAGGWDVEFRVKGDFDIGHYQNFVTTLSLNQQFSTSVDDGLPSCIGPGRGDIVLYQSQTLERKLYRRPLIGIFTPSSDSCYAFFLMHRELPDTSSRLRLSRISDLLESLKEDSAAKEILLHEYAIDPATGKARSDLLASGRRLARLNNNWNFSGNIPVTSTETRGGTYESAGTFKWAVGASIAVKLKLLGRKGGIDGYFEYGRETGSGSSADSSLTISYTLADNESWDNFSVNVYYDSLQRTYLFEVDSTNSYASFPYEDAYARRSVDLEVVGADTLKTGLMGEMLSYNIEISNVSPPAVLGLPSPLTIQSEVVNFPYQINLLPQEFNLARDAAGSVTVQLSSPDSGTFNSIVRFTLMHPAGGNGSVALDIPLQAVFQKAQYGIYVECQENTFTIEAAASSVTHSFPITLKNIGETPVTIETNISSVSEGVTYQLGGFSNPVASGETRTISVALTGTGYYYPFTATFWAKIQGDESSYREILLSIDTSSGQAQIVTPTARKPRQLEISAGYRGVAVYVPGTVPASVSLFTMSGRCIYKSENILGSWFLPGLTEKARMLPCIIDLRHKGKRITRVIMLKH